MFILPYQIGSILFHCTTCLAIFSLPLYNGRVIDRERRRKK
ncbi:hypothetical protein GS8_2033 [Geobacillus stearothermophilus]|uniref:Uncharacterized protein n=1 Tax=Geobacillus stearothermophilus TaxID=1422 RepID=A0A150NCS6_GEOSE|nr:hypothetical protein GS8_2033 [Geobacillus stearothermophilus]KYD34392.1 hypothetical protein B4114_1897 [Geobacillus stearothermophilus]